MIITTSRFQTNAYIKINYLIQGGCISNCYSTFCEAFWDQGRFVWVKNQKAWRNTAWWWRSSILLPKFVLFYLSVSNKFTVVRQLSPINLVDPGKIKRFVFSMLWLYSVLLLWVNLKFRVRGVAFSTRCSPQMSNRMVDKARGPDIRFIFKMNVVCFRRFE